MFTDFISANRDEIVRRTRARANDRPAPRANDAEMERGIPLFLDQLIVRLVSTATSSDPVIASAKTHGADMSRHGFTIKQVCEGYGDICQVVTELAIESRAPISTEDFRALNECLDTATTEAVGGYEAQRDVTRSAAGTERLGFLAHELRNHLYMAMLSYDLLKRGDVAINGSTGAVLGRSLSSLRALIDRSLAEVRLEGGVRHEERVSIRDFLEERPRRPAPSLRSRKARTARRVGSRSSSSGSSQPRSTPDRPSFSAARCACWRGACSCCRGSRTAAVCSRGSSRSSSPSEEKNGWRSRR